GPLTHRTLQRPRCLADYSLPQRRTSKPSSRARATTNQIEEGSPTILHRTANLSPPGAKVGREGRDPTSAAAWAADLQSAAIVSSAACPNVGLIDAASIGQASRLKKSLCYGIRAFDAFPEEPRGIVRGAGGGI